MQMHTDSKKLRFALTMKTRSHIVGRPDQALNRIAKSITPFILVKAAPLIVTLRGNTPDVYG